MLKLKVAVLAIALAGSASADGWRSLRLDATSEASFTKSVAAFQETLPAARRLVFNAALHDIWLQGTQDADRAQREYTSSEYFQTLDGLGYKGITTLTDSTGETARTRYRAAYASLGRAWPQRIPDIMRTNGVFINPDPNHQ
jgi:hypothetical protein